MSAYDTAALVAQVRRVTFAPTASATGTTDADILALATFELHSELVPQLREVREEWFVTSQDITVQSGVAAYAIPSRAVAGSLRDVWMVMPDGSVRPFPRRDLSAIPNIFLAPPASTGTPVCFFLEANDVVLYPSPAAGNLGALRMFFELRPNDLCLPSAAGVVQSVNASTGVVTLAGLGVPAGFSTSAPCDFVKGTPHFQTRGFDKLPTAVGANTITFATADLPVGLAPGDYVCLAGQSPVPQLPYELHPVLVQRTVAKVLESLGDGQKGALALQKAETLAQRAYGLLSPRVTGKPRRSVNRSWI